MKLRSTPRREFLRTLAAEIVHNYGRGRTIIAIDGTRDSGRAAFADDAAAVLGDADGRRVFRASLDDFQISRADRNRFGPESAERHYRHGYDYSALRRVLVEPFRMGGSTGFVTEQFDAGRDEWIEPTWHTAPPDAILVIDGEFANRSELHDLWSFSMLLESAATNPADRIYLDEVGPRTLVNALIDNTDESLPRRVFTDSC